MYIYGVRVYKYLYLYINSGRSALAYELDKEQAGPVEHDALKTKPSFTQVLCHCLNHAEVIVHKFASVNKCDGLFLIHL